MGNGLLHQFIGLDLGKSRDYSAVAMVERVEIAEGERDPVTFEPRMARRYRVRHLERVPLGTLYPDVVERVRDVVQKVSACGPCLLVMDATGVGAPVLDMLRRARLGCAVVPVILTGGEKQQHGDGVWRVPKQHLITGLQVMLEKRELGAPEKSMGTKLLQREMRDMEARVGRGGGVSYGARREGEHDDLVMAAALACWRATWRVEGIWGMRSLGL
jgi:hypothetical protein